MVNKSVSLTNTALLLAEKARVNAPRAKFGIQETLTAVEVGLFLGWQAVREGTHGDMEWQKWRLGQDLDHFNDSPYSNSRIWNAAIAMHVQTPPNQDNGYLGHVLRENSGALIKESAKLVWEIGLGPIIAGQGESERMINEILNQQRRELKAIGEEIMSRQMVESQALAGKETEPR
jgi:hypothetical protein